MAQRELNDKRNKSPIESEMKIIYSHGVNKEYGSKFLGYHRGYLEDTMAKKCCEYNN